MRAGHYRQVDVPDSALKEALVGWAWRVTTRWWANMEGLRQAKWLIGAVPPSGWVQAAGQLDRRRLRLAVGWLTGHWRVGHHLSGMRLARNGNCR